MQDLQEKIGQFPNQPGVYRMKDQAGRFLYIGKAKDLRKRVSSYWSKRARDRYQIEFLLRKVADVDCIVTDNEKEALILEDTLIKKHKPKYNVDLKDNKTYLSIKLSIKDRFPRLYVTRQIVPDGSLYFGPYTSAFACRQVADFIEKYFGLRTCSDRELVSRKRPCIQYQMGRCPAPCVGLIDEGPYRDLVDEVQWVLEGKSREIRERISARMQEASDALRFEEAARFRDLLGNLDQTLEVQKMASHRAGDQDFIGLYREGERGVIAALMVRGGKVVETRWFPFKDLSEDRELLETFLLQFYGEGRFVPAEIYVQLPLEDETVLAEILSETGRRNVLIHSPQRGEKADMVQLAMRNAREDFQRSLKRAEDLEEILQRLEHKLHLKRLPRRMECFDISNIGGRQPVGSMVCFHEGEPDKDSYRRFKIRTLPEQPNDYAMMYEVLSRRFKKADWEPPDLLVIDGGKGQLSIARRVLEELDILSVDLCALAKKKEGEDRDKIFTPGRKNPILLPKNSSELHLLMRLRNEAHRFAITYHRKLRAKKLHTSKLDTIPGIGEKRKKDLLRHFGSLVKVMAANQDELAAVPGLSQQLASKIYTGLRS